jgi:hypothetical protein
LGTNSGYPSYFCVFQRPRVPTKASM